MHLSTKAKATGDGVDRNANKGIDDWFRPRWMNLTGPVMVCQPKTCNMTTYGLDKIVEEW
jgi:hypothetical protein